jgi:hypothetical protein
MATIKRSSTRTKARVEETESGAGRVPRSAAHRGTAIATADGELQISCQLSELVPVAQYANVTIGPVQLVWKTANPGIEILGDIDWDEGDEEPVLTAEQRKVYDTVRGYIRATSKLIEHSIAEDRELVEESVRLHNEREAEEQQAKAKTASRSRSRSRK